MPRLTMQITRGTPEYLKRCRNPGSRVWWVRSEVDHQVVGPDCPNPGAYPASFEIELGLGIHTLGTGTRTRHLFCVSMAAKDGDIVRIDGRTGDVLTPAFRLPR